VSDGKQLPHDYKIKVTEHVQTDDRPNIQTYALCTFTFSLQTFTIFFLINAFINVYYNFFDVYHIYATSNLQTHGNKQTHQFNTV